MMKMIMTITAILATLTLTGCSLDNELRPFIPVEAAGNDSSIVSTVSEVEEPIASTSEVEIVINVPKPAASTSIVSSVESKPEEKPVESTSTIVETPVEKPIASTTSTVVEKPVASTSTSTVKPVASTTTTSSKVEKPISSSTSSKPSVPVSTSTSYTKPVVSSSKPVEKVHNCSTDGHVWNVTTTTTEPKWCREMHVVYDNGYDVTLASRYLGVDGGQAYYTFIDNMEAIGVDGAAGSATIEVEVWGTETYETRKCTECGHLNVDANIFTITPIGEWRYINGVNPRTRNSVIKFDTLFYDPYNVPQEVINNINLSWELIWG